ncbi:hypothetical protein [Gloeothece citriformis]|uniref:hypothetical protein n=1 Tax=Gloeothece citriformis TaxID=2546356 RepID=UPI0002D9F9F2|nr:hypothetical protein [Gloeothece citriformis]
MYLDEIKNSDRFDKIITLFPFEYLKAEKHAVNSDIYYHLLTEQSKPRPNGCTVS